jgi:hypothetical protein
MASNKERIRWELNIFPRVGTNRRRSLRYYHTENIFYGPFFQLLGENVQYMVCLN